MITLSLLAMSAGFSWLMASTNPVKAAMSVLLVSSSMFFIMALTTSMTWIPIIMLMLFMGGILMMFMILSSIQPNEKSPKSKNLVVLMATIVVTQLGTLWSWYPTSIGMESKSFLMSGLNFYIMLSLILCYFLMSMSMINAEETPMRSIICRYSFGFVS